MQTSRRVLHESEGPFLSQNVLSAAWNGDVKVGCQVNGDGSWGPSLGPLCARRGSVDQQLLQARKRNSSHCSRGAAICHSQPSLILGKPRTNPDHRCGLCFRVAPSVR